MFESVQTLLAEHDELQNQLADPELHSDPARSKKVNRRYAELARIIAAYHEWRQLTDDVDAATEMAAEDESFAAELPGLTESLEAAQEKLRRLLIPRDPNDARDVIMEIKMGEGGAESALFAGDLLRMYLHYAESKKWKTEIIEQTSSDLGGIKDVQVAFKGNSSDPAEGIWAHFKYEGGVHRVQRVPATESQGRIHTSAATVAIIAEDAGDIEIEINPVDLRVDTFRSSGAGGQHVNKTESAIRITHMPSGVVVESQTERSQHANRDKAMKRLKAMLLEAETAKRDAAQAQERKLQVGSGDRSQRIRTYNFPQGRITDHRVEGLTLYDLPNIIQGNIDELIERLAREHQADELARLTQGG